MTDETTFSFIDGFMLRYGIGVAETHKAGVQGVNASSGEDVYLLISVLTF